jgi:hypothetical protein
MPTKIYEYIASGTPILSFGSMQNDECGTLLLKSGNCLRIKNFHDLESFFENSLVDSLQMPERRAEFIRKFQFSSQVRTLEYLLNNFMTEIESVSLEN